MAGVWWYHLRMRRARQTALALGLYLMLGLALVALAALGLPETAVLYAAAALAALGVVAAIAATLFAVYDVQRGAPQKKAAAADARPSEATA